jgi:MerR family transcriptional regulator, light-induced transcriptional regulator
VPIYFTLERQIEEEVVVVAQFKFEKAAVSQDKRWTFESQASKVNFRLGDSPRLVGGSTFVKKSGLDHRHVSLLTKAALKSMDETRDILMGWRRQGHTLADIYLNGIGLSAQLLGEYWSSDEIDFVHCTIAFSRLHQILHEFSSVFLSEGCSEPNGLNLLLMTEPGSHHGLGVFMLSEFFRHAGWSVTLCAPQDMAEFKRIFQSDWFDAVTLSISTDRHLDVVALALSDTLPLVVNPNLKVYVGGPMAQIAPAKLNWPGTHLLNGNADQAVTIVTQSIKKTERQFNVTSNLSEYSLILNP